MQYHCNKLRFGDGLQTSKSDQNYTSMNQTLAENQLAEIFIKCEEQCVIGICLCEDNIIANTRRHFRDVSHTVPFLAQSLDDWSINALIG